ncbi:MAG: HNH endonuclease [Patescibacteria group bacterium]
MRRRKWRPEDLKNAAKTSYSIREVLRKLGLVPAGGNYSQINKYLKEYKIDHSHFKGSAWNKGIKGLLSPRIPLEKILIKNSTFQSNKLKKRLFSVGIKRPACEACGWDEKNIEGYQPLELDHINGDRTDNRLENLRILCPNCHSLQPTHRGRNMRRRK